MSLSRYLCSLRVALAVIGITIACAPVTNAYSFNALEECMKLTTVDDDIHNCLDNYLDQLDESILSISDTIANDLNDAPLDKFQLAQTAFYEYRKQNCLWYLEFSSPRNEAEKVAKNCLATMSIQRLSELQSLRSSNKNHLNILRGFYVYGSFRNSFQPCGANERYWVEGDNELVGQLQQDYLQKSTADLQVLYVELSGRVVPGQEYESHNGILNITDLTTLRVPSENDCRLPGVRTAQSLAIAPTVQVAPLEPTPTEPQIAPITSDDPEQVLRAYFGAWLASCTQRRDNFMCEVSVEFEGPGVNNETRPNLVLTRRSGKRTVVELEFPVLEIDSPTKIIWRVDKLFIGDIVNSRIRVDEKSTRQLIAERRFIQDDLLPLMIRGFDLQVEVLEDIDDTSGDKYTASLKGLTRALAFADDFVSNGGTVK